MRSTKALICIHIPVACCHLSSFILRYLAYVDESNANMYGSVCIISLAFACFLQPVIAMLVSSALRKAFVGLICRKSNNSNTRVFKLTLETPHPREERSGHSEMPEFLRPRSGMRIQLEVVQESDSISQCRSRRLSAISMTSDGISVIDIDEYTAPMDTENSGSIGSLVCQADGSSRSPSLSTMSNLTLNISDLPWPRAKQRNKVTNKFWMESSPSSQQSFFQDGATENDMMHRTSSLPTIRISSPRTPKTPGRKLFKRVFPNERMCTLATVEDVMSAASSPRSSEVS
ncbi:hypothetical protein FSP39_014453 [Pinctada imbricata]|uniref:Uncharacterized protein n=1 Tax=Pinctada imbricata TaxID=66713 RepID=A0AA89BZY4_PINIB|nr:hypothetical protein FSP39_014453 [Pinctada imbricata]